MSAYYEEKVVDPPVGDPLPFKLNYSPRAYELPGQPISLDKSGTVVARQVGGGVPRKPFRVTVITEAAKPATVTAGALPEKPVSVFVLTSVDAPESVTVVAAPRKPNTVSVQADPIKPASVTADAMPFAPTSVAAFSDPKKPTSIDADYIPYAPASVTADAMPFAPTSVVAESDPKKPISVDADYIPHAPAIVEVNAMPIAPVGVAAFSDPKKPISVDADYIPYAPSSVDADYIPYAPSVVSVNADPKQPLTVDADYIPYAPASVSAGQVPNTPSLVEAGVIPEVPSTVSVLAAPRQPSLAYAFSPFVVGIMEPEADIVVRPSSTPEGTVAFGTDTKKLYVFNKTGIDSWGAFAQDGSFKYDQYSIKSDFEGSTGDYFGANVQAVDFSNGLTISTWFKFNWNASMHILGVGGADGDAFSVGQSGYNTCLMTKGTQDLLYFRAPYQDSNGTNHNPNFSIGAYNSNQWYHFTLTYGANKDLKIYIDGASVFEMNMQNGLNIFTYNYSIGVFGGGFRAENWFRNSDSNINEIALWNRPLTPVEASDLYYNGVPQLLDLNPTAWWRMGDGSEGASGTAIQDVTGSGYDGVINVDTNTITYEEDTPPPVPYSNRHSLSFDGVDGQVNCGNVTSLVSATAFSLSYWFKPVTQGVGASIGMRFNAQNQYAFYNNRFYIFTQPTGTSLAYTPPADTNWHNYAVSYDAGSVSIYIDGVEVASATNFPTNLPIATMQDEFYIGSYGALTGSFSSEGSFDEVALFTTALSATDITAIYNGGTPDNIADLSPKHWWRMGDNNSGVGTIIPDMGAVKLDGTLVGGATFSTDVPTQ